MAIDYDKIMSMKTNDVEYSYTDNDTMLYALGIGFGRDPLNRKELDFVYEKNLKTIPSMATVIAWGAGHMRDNWNQLSYGRAWRTKIKNTSTTSSFSKYFGRL